MRVAALYDMHGNRPALEGVLDDVRRARVELVIVGGDVVPGPVAAECIERLRDLDVPVRYLRGNGAAPRDFVTATRHWSEGPTRAGGPTFRSAYATRRMERGATHSESRASRTALLRLASTTSRVTSTRAARDP